MKNDYLYEQTFYNVFWRYSTFFVNEIIENSNLNCKKNKQNVLNNNSNSLKNYQKLKLKKIRQEKTKI